MKFLRNYEETHHPTTGFSNSDKSRAMPEQSNLQNDVSEIRARDAKQKLQAKQYADQKSYVKTWSIKVGDVVLLRNERKGKVVPVCDPRP